MTAAKTDVLYRLHAEMCKVFTSPKRVEILNLLRAREFSVNELAEKAGIPQSNVSQHLALLKGRDIVKTRREGSRIYYSLADKRISAAFDIIREMLLDKLGRAARLSRSVGAGR